MYCGTIIFLLLWFLQSCQSKNVPYVTSYSGKIVGHYKLSSKGKNYEAYEGIPYALPPVGERRFRVRMRHINATFTICLDETIYRLSDVM